MTVPEFQTQSQSRPAPEMPFSDRFRTLLEQPMMSDVSFQVGPDDSNLTTIPAHKLVLAMGSPVFQQMFFGSATGFAADIKPIRLPHVSLSAFRTLLRFLYTGESHVEEEFAVQSLVVARQYDVSALVKNVAAFIQQRVNPISASSFLAQASAADEVELAVYCLTKLAPTPTKLLLTPEFLDINQKTLCALVASDCFAGYEGPLCIGLNRWAEHACVAAGMDASPENKRVQLGDALKAVKLTKLTAKQIVDGPVRDGLLSPERALEMLSSRLGEGSSPLGDPEISPSSSVRTDFAHVSRFPNGHTSQVDPAMHPCLALPHCLGLTCNLSLDLHGVGLYNSTEKCFVTLMAFRKNPDQLIASASALLEPAAGPTDTVRTVLFPTPLRIVPMQNYELAVVYVKGLPRIRGHTGFRKIVGPEGCFILNLTSVAQPEHYEVAAKHLGGNSFNRRVGGCAKCHPHMKTPNNNNNNMRPNNDNRQCDCQLVPGLTNDVAGQIPDLLISLVDLPPKTNRPTPARPVNGAAPVAEDADMW